MSELFDEAKECIAALSGRLVETKVDTSSTEPWIKQPHVILKLTKEDSLKTAEYFRKLVEAEKFEEIMVLWKLLQKDINVLLSIHPYIEKVMVETAVRNAKLVDEIKLAKSGEKL